MRKQTAAVNSRPGEWADPFSDPSPRKGGKQVAAEAPVVEDDEDLRPAPRKTAAAAPRRQARSSRVGRRLGRPVRADGGSRKSTGTPPRGSARRAEQAAPRRPRVAVAAASGTTLSRPTKRRPVEAGGAPVVATREPAAKHESKKFAATPTATHKAVAAEEPAGKTPAQGRWGTS